MQRQSCEWFFSVSLGSCQSSERGTQERNWPKGKQHKPVNASTLTVHLCVVLEEERKREKAILCGVEGLG